MPTGHLQAAEKRYPVLLSRHPANYPQVTPVTNRQHIPNIVLLFLDTQLTLRYNSSKEKQVLIKK
jgi:hypothetical protein